MSYHSIQVVTGGAGLIGLPLCKRLMDLGNHVVCVDNFSTTSRSNIDEAHKMHNDPTCNFRLVKADVREKFAPIWTSQSFWGDSGKNEYKVVGIYHLACPASPVQYLKDPYGTIMTCIKGTELVLGWLGLAGSDCRLVVASTSEIYGEPEVHPQDENYRGCVTTVGPRSCYDEGKRAMEAMCRSILDGGKDFDIGIVRIFNTYGPGEDLKDGRVINSFVVNAIMGKQINIFGDGRQTRSFCFVDDLVLGLISMGQKKGEFGPINLGNPEELSVLDLAQMVKRITRSESQIVKRSARVDDPTRRCPNIDRARNLLGWTPKVKLEDGLLKVINYFNMELQK